MTKMYIKISQNKYLKNDTDSFLFFIDNISVGKKVLWINNTYIRYISYFLIKYIFTGAFYFWAMNYFSKQIQIDENFIFKVQWAWNWSNSITIQDIKWEIKVIKKTSSIKSFNNEKDFYELYWNTPSKILLPKSTFTSENVIEMDFITWGSFMNWIQFWKVSYQESLNIFNDIKKHIEWFYPEKWQYIIHWDLWTANIYIRNTNYYLIDYSDSFVSDKNYDLYILLKSILADFWKIERSTRIFQHNTQGLFLSKLGISDKYLQEIEEIYFHKLELKHGKQN